jgi:hypothetical protein
MFQKIREDVLIAKLQNMIKREQDREQIDLLQKMIADLEQQMRETGLKWPSPSTRSVATSAPRPNCASR